MPTTLQLRRGTTSQNNAFTGSVGEVSVDTDKDTLRVHDGATAGGFEVVTTSATQTLTNKTLTSPIINSPTISQAAFSGASFTFEGATDDSFETTLIATDPTADRTVTIPNATTTLVGQDTTDELTNKTINSSSNTITISGSEATLSNIANASLTNSSITVTDGSTSTATSLGGTITFSGTANEVEVGESSGTITIGLPDNVTIGGNATITGNLTVNGTTTTVSSTNTTIADNLLELNSGAASNANDTGILIERGSTGDNAIIAWDESADKFTVGTTTATASDTGNLTITTGTLVANIEGNVTGDITGNAGTATTLETARTIGGVSFNGSANINLPGVNTSGNQDTSGNAATATALETARTIAGQSFDGTGNITIASTDLSNTSDIVLLTSTQTLTNKTLTTPNIAQIDATTTMTINAGTDITLDADGGDVFLKDASTQYGALTNTSGNLIIKSGTTTALTFSGADVTAAGTITGNGSGLNTLNASELDSGTIPDARFPATLPAANGSALTSLNASNLSSGTVDNARLDAQLQDVAGLAVTDGNFIVGNGSNFVAESGSTARDSLSLGTGSDVQFDSLGLGTAAAGTTGTIRATNDITAFYSSDVAFKENIVNIPSPLEMLKKIRGVFFDWKQDWIDKNGGEDGYFVRKRDVGVIAQEVEKVMPEIVATRTDGSKAVKYDRLTTVLIEAVKQLQEEIEELKAKK